VGRRSLAEAQTLDIGRLAHLTDASPTLSEAPAEAPHALTDGPGLLFLDTETTSLGMGAGVYVFLVGLGWFTSKGFCVEQFLLKDIPAEPQLLEAVTARVRAARLLVSFGGRGFDVHRLEDRFRFNRMPTPFAREHHADLLTLGRAVFGTRLTSCALQALERHALGLVRPHDLPGALCPEAYFTWVREGARSLGSIEPVLEHNHQDVVSLAALADDLLARERVPHHPGELLGFGRHHRRRRRLEEAELVLKRAFALHHQPGLPNLDRHEILLLRRELMLVLRRQKKHEPAIEILRPLLNDPAPPIDLLIGLARLAEHRTRDLRLARHAATAALSALRTRGADLPPARVERFSNDLTRRLARLDAKRKRWAKKRAPAGGSPSSPETA
jgi:uncharacterized protein YprB with RNaseH-like and TPR domain